MLELAGPSWRQLRSSGHAPDDEDDDDIMLLLCTKHQLDAYVFQYAR